MIDLVGETALTDRTLFHGMARNTRPLNHTGKARPLVAKTGLFECNREFFKAIDLKNCSRRVVSRKLETAKLFIWYSSDFRHARVKTIAADFSH